MSTSREMPAAAATIEALLAGTLADPDGGPALRVPVQMVAIEPGLAGGEAELVAALGFGAKLAVVDDPQTGAALGERVRRALSARFAVTALTLPGRPEADLDTVTRLRPWLRDQDAVIAVGSGTINDLCKYAALLEDKPYAVFATAPSMNGYVSPSAAISVQGHKKSLPARAPIGVFIDLAVLAAAPPRMIRAGLGDSLCRPTAEADWLLAHLLLDRPFRTAPFALLAADEAGLMAEPEALMAGDLEATARLARTLVLSGFGMCLCGSSHPASQGEHLISHYADMMGDPAWPRAFHGEQVGVAAITMARLQERMLDDAAPRLRASRVTEADVVAHYGPEIGPACWQEFARKRLDRARAEALSERLRLGWDGIRTRLAAATVPAHDIAAALQRAGAPTTPSELGWPDGFYRRAVRRAREIRDRYTFLDLAADSGRLDRWDPL